MLDVRRISVRIRSATYQAEGINSYEFEPAGEDRLPPFEPGSHIDVFLPGNIVRQYSLCNDAADDNRYVIGVQREEAGRGGSRLLFECARPGAILQISEPRNHFSLSKTSPSHLFLAGGIGITPMMSMIRTLGREKKPFELHYCTRSPEKTAFRRELAAIRPAGCVHFHHDNGNPAEGLDIASLLAEPRADTALYYCGPPGFMAAIRAACEGWPPENVHFEYFEAPAADPAAGGGSSPGGEPRDFTVKLAGTGQEFLVPVGRTIVEVLRENGIDIPTSCEAGVCRTCLTRYLSGTPEHHDYILEDEERGEYVLPCCARSLSDVLVLDL
ncbi:MAG: 2Fe-2S iron-sulfur cluster-binding protein [Hyphomicrobiales bacterium]